MRVLCGRFIGVALFLLLLAGCNQENETSASSTSKPIVDIVTAKAQSVTIENNLPGRLTASRKAVITPRISGIVLKRLYEEGSVVEEGQSLYKLDDGTYRANLKTAKAALVKAEADKKLYQNTVDRYSKLLKSRAVSQEDYDQAVANLEAEDASIASAEASIESAEINLNYTDIKAPITGVIGFSEVTEGAYVVGSTTEMATIRQLDPLYVDLTQGASELLRYKSEIQKGEVEKGSGQDIKILLDDGEEYPSKARLLFIDHSVDESTGEVSIRASVDNPDLNLIPGLYVRVVVSQAIFKNAFLIPQQAITRGEKNTLFVVNKENGIEPRVVTIVGSKNNNWIVTGGVKDGDKVIVDGILPVLIAKSKLSAEDQKNFKVETRDWDNPLIDDEDQSTEQSK